MINYSGGGFVLLLILKSLWMLCVGTIFNELILMHFHLFVYSSSESTTSIYFDPSPNPPSRLQSWPGHARSALAWSLSDKRHEPYSVAWFNASKVERAFSLFISKTSKFGWSSRYIFVQEQQIDYGNVLVLYSSYRTLYIWLEEKLHPNECPNPFSGRNEADLY